MRPSLKAITVYQGNGVASRAQCSMGAWHPLRPGTSRSFQGAGNSRHINRQPRKDGFQELMAPQDRTGGQWPGTVSSGHGGKHPTGRVKEGFISVRRTKRSGWKAFLGGLTWPCWGPLESPFSLRVWDGWGVTLGEEAQGWGKASHCGCLLPSVFVSDLGEDSLFPSFWKGGNQLFLLSGDFSLTFSVLTHESRCLFVCFSWTKQHWTSRLAFWESTSAERMYFEFSQKAREVSEYKAIQVMHISK